MTPDSGVPHDIDSMLLARYLRGEAGRDESVQAERWIAASPEHREFAETLRAAWERPSVSDFDPSDAVWRRLQVQIGQAGSRPTLVAESAERSKRAFQVTGGRRTGLVAAAAAVIAVAASAVILIQPWRERSGTAVSVAEPMREIATRRGERLALRLTDGTRVVLAAESRLRLPETFGARGHNTRELYLEGEAFFEVTHDSTRPFRVHTATGTAEDLGTEFVVTSYPETRGTRVLVASGVVALSRTRLNAPNAPPITLRRGDLGTVDAQGTTHVAQGIDVDPYVAWTDGTVTFSGTPLADALPILRRWYDLDIQLGDSTLAVEPLTATFRDASASQVLDLLAMSLELKVERRGETVVLRR